MSECDESHSASVAQCKSRPVHSKSLQKEIQPEIVETVSVYYSEKYLSYYSLPKKIWYFSL